LRRILKILKTIFHVRERCVHGIHVGGLVVEVEGEKLGRSHAKGQEMTRTEQTKT
jgi:hypothetical protein